MLKKSKKLLAFMLSIALVFTTFGSDLASAVVYAEEDAQQAQAVETWSDIVEDVSVAQKESIGSDEDASGGSDAASEDAQGEETPAEPDEGDGGAVDVPENPTPEEPAEGGEAENPAEPPAENPSETPSEASTESTIDAAGAASTGSSSSEDATEASSEAASEASSEDASEASSEASSEDASEASSEASSEDAAAEASSVEEKLVTVRYKATKGGRVSLFKETININDENAKFEGATATAWNDKYSFVDWTDEDGNQVCADATFVPSGIESDATFTANFIAEEDIEDKMPAIVRENVPAGGLSVSVNAEVGVFPKGTEAVISPVSDNQALESAKDALGDNVAEAKGAEIKFIYEGEEIQPADNKYVHVSLALNTPIEGESFSVVHDHDGEAEVLPDSQVESVDENGAEFKTDEFSIYIVAGEIPEDNRLNVIFKNGDTVISSVYVKKNDLYEGADHVNHFEDIVYDPGVGELDDGVMFRGWAENNAYTTTTEGLDIDGVRAKVRAKLEAGVNDGATVTYYAMLFKAYTVSYLDDRTASLGSSEIKFRADDTTEYQQYTVNMSFTPSDNEHKFEGWLATKGGANIDGYTEGTRYQNGTSIGIKGDVTFSVDLPAGHWLVFDENGKGATYNAPQFVKADEVTQKPCEDNEMVRNGYEFQGWFTGTKDTNGNVTLGEAFEFGHALTEMTTIFAKWKAKENAAYTVLIWKQNIDANGYDFEKSIPLSGTSGSSINIVSIQGNGNSAYTRIDGTDYKYTGFHYESTDQDGKTITPEGNTVVNVYYNRNQRKLTFQVQYTVSTNDNDNNPTKYGFINSNFQQIYWRNGAFRTSNNNNGTVYNGTVFVKSNTWLTIKEITALYGQSIKDNFPIVGTDGVNYEGSWWEEPSHNTYDAKVAYIDIMLDADVVFHKYDLPQLYNYDRTINYYVEALPGETGQTVSYNGKTFVKYTSQVTNGYMHWTEDEDYFELAGFTKFGYTPSNAWNIRDDVRTVNCYYTRNTYKINFMDGSYFDGNDNRLNEIDRGHLGIKENILYQANISAYADQEPSTIPTGYVFEGWYVDDACTQKYNFNKMPEGGITVYAKWRQIQYRVFLHPNAGEDSTLDWGSETQAMNFRISYGGKVDTPTGRRTGFEFVGWYLDPGFDNSFNADAFVLNETTVTAGYNKDTDLTDPMNKWGKGATYNSDKTGYNGGDRFWITKKLDLYARWRSTLDGATGIGIIYDANGGSPAPSDTNLYADTANAAAGAAPTTTPKITENGKEYETRFSHWVVQKWNSTTEQYEDTTDTVLPGATFVVKKENAKEVDLGVTEDNKPIKSYTVQLRAEYVKVEMPTPTHIIWFNNYDGGSYRIDPKVDVNVAVKVYGIGDGESIPTRAGYTFKGWARDDEHENGLSEVTDLFIEYNQETGTYNHEFVAADEKQPYHALYAVWDAAEVDLIYDANGGTGSMDPSTGKVGTDVEVKENGFTNPGYKFDGWNTSADGNGTPYDEHASYTLQAEGNILYAIWTEDENDTYKISYISAGNGSVNPEEETHQVLDTQDKIAGSKATAAAGYTFDGWYKDGEKVSDAAQISAATVYGNLNTRQKDGLPADTTFEARFVIDVNDTYTISYTSAGNGSVTPEDETHQVLDTQDKIVGSKATADAGYKFDGWYKGGEKVSDTAQISAADVYGNLNTREKDGLPADTTFEARFVIDVDDTYTISYTTDGNGSADPEDETHQVLDTQDKIAGSKATAKAGYVFEGWYKNGEKVADTAQISAETVYGNLNTREKDGLPADTTFEARFIIDVNDTYIISYISAGNGSVTPENETHQVLDTQDKIAGSKATAAAGYKFDGWYKDGEKIANAGVELTAEFIYSRLNTRQKDGLPTDTTFEARFVIDVDDTYTISYTTDGNGSADPEDETHQVLDTQDKISGSKAKANSGYVFEGWYKNGEKVADTAQISAETVYANLNTREKDGLHDDTTFEARFIIDVNDTYTISYTSAGNGSVTPEDETHQVLDTQDKIAGSKATAAAGYKFDGWYKDGEKIANAGVELTAEFIYSRLNTREEDGLPADTTFEARFVIDENDTYTISYTSAGNGSVNPGDETHQVLDTQDKIVGSEATANAGYKFDGWYKGEEKVADTAVISAATVYSKLNTREKDGLPADTTFEARFVIDDEDTYKISYTSAGNGSVNPEEETHQVLDTQDKISGSEATAAAGYKFDGWYKGEEKVADTAVISAATVYSRLNTREKDGLPADTTFEARFVIDENDTYTISYTSAGNGSVNPGDETHQVLDTQDKIVGSEATANAGYKFDGWYKGEEKVADTAVISAATVYSKLNTREKDGLPADTTFEARFVIDDEDTYKISYTSAGNGAVNPEEETHQVLDTQDKISGSEATAAAGYKFDGWYKGEEKVADTAVISAATVYSKLNTREKDGLPADTTFEARFVIDDEDTYKISYTSAGNGSVTPEEETHQVLDTQDKISGSEATAAAGYKFDGWYKGEEKVADTAIISAATVYGKLNTREKDGLPADTTFEARFVIDDEDTYKISYTTDGNGSANPDEEIRQVLDTQDKISGSEATAAAGYKFDGWYKGEEKVADSAQISAATVYANLNTRAKDGLPADTTFEARFVIDVNDTYKISYISAGNGSVNPEEEIHQVLDTQDKIAGSEAKADAGYKFDGWYKDGEKIANAGEKLTAEFIYSLLNTREKDGLPADTTFEARFVTDDEDTYKISYTTDGNGSANPEDETHQVLDTQDKIGGSEATANAGYVFEGWYKGEEKVADTAQISAETVYANLNTREKDGLHDDTTFEARFVLDVNDTYKISYISAGNGSVNPEEEIHQVLDTQDKIAGSEAKADAGYKFDGWYKDGEKIANAGEKLTAEFIYSLLNTREKDGLPADTTFEARFVIDVNDTYTITYTSAGNGEVAPKEETHQVLDGEDKISGSEATPAAGYKFDGWYKDGERVPDAEAIITAVRVYSNLNTRDKDGLPADTTFEARFVIDDDDTYKISYTTDGNGSADPEDETHQVLDTQDKITGSEATPKAGYVFEGWYKDDEKVADTAQISAATVYSLLNTREKDGLPADTTFEARFVIDVNDTYKISYISAGNGSVNPEEEIHQVLDTQDKIAGSEAKADAGYKFDGWYKDGEKIANAGEKLTAEFIYSLLNTREKDGLPADTTFEARFVTDDEDTYKISYTTDGNGSANPEDETHQVLDTQDKIGGSEATANAGYVFEGWYKGEEKVADTAQISAETVYANLNTREKDGLHDDTTFEARFVLDVNDTYKISYISAGNGSVNPEEEIHQVLDTQDKIAGSEAKADAGYKFDGWYKDGEKIANAGEKLTAEFIYSLLNTREKDGLPADTTFEARFVIDVNDTYTITYTSAGNGEVAPKEETHQVLDGEDKISGSEATPAAGYKFDGWYKDGERVPDAEAIITAVRVYSNLNTRDKDGLPADTTFEARFVIDDDDTYKISYTTDGNGSADPEDETHQVLDTQDKITGSEATPKAGYVFEGWYKDDEKVADTAQISAATVYSLLNTREKDGLPADTTFEARFVIDVNDTYKISYVSAGNGSVNPEEEIHQVLDTQDKIAGSEAKADAGYKFDGWYKDGEKIANAGETISAAFVYANLNTREKDGLPADTTFEARFVTDDEDTYKISYTTDGNGSANPEDETHQVLDTQDKIGGSEAKANAGYVFEGWYKGEEKVADTATISAEVVYANLNTRAKDGLHDDTTFEARFVLDVNDTYKVEYKTDGNGTATPAEESHQVLDTASITGSKAEANPGYVFDGWYKGDEKIAGAGETIAPAFVIDNLDKREDGLPAKVTTFTARFKLDENAKFTVTYLTDGNGTATPGEETHQALVTVSDITGSLAKAKEGYKFEGWYKGDTKIAGATEQFSPGLVYANLEKKANGLPDNTTFTAKFEKDESQQKEIVYTVNHVVDGEIKATDKFTFKVWVGDPDTVKVTAASIKPNEYEGYEYTKTVNADGGAEIKADDEVENKTVINVIYDPVTVTIRYEYRPGPGVTLPSDLPELPAAYEAQFGDIINVPDVPTYKGYSFTDWEMEKDETDTGILSFISEIFGTVYKFMAGLGREQVGASTMVAPAYDVVIYTIVTKNATPTPPGPTPDDPTPTPPTPPTPTPDPAPADPTPTPAAPVAATPAAGQAVLGATRDDTTGNGRAVLGARRGRTDDETNSSARVFAILVSAAVAISLFFTGKKKEEEEK